MAPRAASRLIDLHGVGVAQATRQADTDPLRSGFIFMALTHAVSGQPLDVRPFGNRMATEKTTALFKSRDLEVMRLVLLTGKSLPPHKVQGEITIHCLEGSLGIELDEKTVRLEAGELLFLAADAMHGVNAVTDATALVTIALKS
jgi:quercetin dioxygenase-like cupin family protein